MHPQAKTIDAINNAKYSSQFSYADIYCIYFLLVIRVNIMSVTNEIKYLRSLVSFCQVLMKPVIIHEFSVRMSVCVVRVPRCMYNPFACSKNRFPIFNVPIHSDRTLVGTLMRVLCQAYVSCCVCIKKIQFVTLFSSPDIQLINKFIWRLTSFLFANHQQ